jgi:hypothetical protein
MKSYCPCCKAELVPASRRKKKCPECDQAIYARDGKLPQGYDSFMKVWIGRG